MDGGGLKEPVVKERGSVDEGIRELVESGSAGRPPVTVLVERPPPLNDPPLLNGGGGFSLSTTGTSQSSPSPNPTPVHISAKTQCA